MEIREERNLSITLSIIEKEVRKNRNQEVRLSTHNRNKEGTQ